MSRYYAIIPAAGKSHRMGQQKLLLPWGDWTVMDQLLWAWSASQVDAIAVVVRDDDVELRKACQRWPVHIVKAIDDPRDMKESICIGLRFVEEHWRPAKEDQCFVAPADLPGLHPSVIDQLIDADVDAAAVKVPRFGNRQGHPVVLPWPMTERVLELPEGQGMDKIIQQHTQHVVSMAESEYFGDVDTPADYTRLMDRWNRRNTQ